MMDAWKETGAAGFSFEVIEELERNETQSDREFSDDVNTIYAPDYFSILIFLFQSFSGRLIHFVSPSFFNSEFLLRISL